MTYVWLALILIDHSPIVMGILLTIASREKIGNTNDGNGQ